MVSILVKWSLGAKSVLVSVLKKNSRMPLKIPFFSREKKDKSSNEVLENAFLCVVFTEKGIRAAFWNIQDGEIHTQKVSALHPFQNDEEGVIATDDALKELGAESEKIDEVVFGFDPKWVNDSGLIKEKKPFIKKLTESLALKPVGFVVLTDALVQDILSREKTISQIVVYVQETAVSLLLLKHGKVSQQLSVGRSEEIVPDIIEGLARFSQEKEGEKTEYLPAKMVLASLVLPPSELQEIRSQIIGYDWTDKHSFVQKPLIEQFVPDQVLQSVIVQGGFAVAEARSIPLQKDTEEKTLDGSGDSDSALAESKDFGFETVATDLVGDNIGPVKPEEQSHATSFGIPIAPESLPADSLHASAHSNSRHASTEALKEAEEDKKHLAAHKKNIFKQAYLWYKHNPHKNIILGGVVGGVLASLGLFWGWMVFTYKVQVSVQLAEKIITKDVEIIVDPKIASSNIEKKILKGDVETGEFSETKAVDTTGVKLVGEKAKGSITIFNKTTSPKKFTAGTVFTGKGMSFTLDKEIEIASASVTAVSGGETKDYGKNDDDTVVTITATKIGAEGNIPEETPLTIANFDSGTYSAVVLETFTGGSSREIRVVSDSDMTSLLQEVKKSLFSKARDSFKEKSGNGIYYVLTGNQKVKKSEYGAKVGEEADQIALELTLEVEAVKYASQDIQPLVIELLKEEVPEGYSLIDKDPEILSFPKEEASGSAQVVLSANVSTKALPSFDAEAAKTALVNLPFEAISGKLTERPYIKSAQYKIKPPLARLFVSKVPSDLKRIEITIGETTQ